jgi:glucose/arabinose dehydrogenase
MKTPILRSAPPFGLILFLLSAGIGPAVVPPLEMVPVAIDQFFSPVVVTHAGDGSGRLFVADQLGMIRVFKDGYVLPVPFLDLSAKLVALGANYDERGLLGLAFHPDYAMSGAAGEGRFYVYYSAPSPNAPGTAASPVNHESVVAEYRVSASDPEVADAASGRILLTVDQPQSNHNGGQLAFGPADGLLYISLGDGGSANDNNAGHTGGSSARPADALGNAQDRTNLLGKVLRIDPLATTGPGGGYGIPLDNPFVGDGFGIREEIYAYGLRNPWRFSFDEGAGGTGRLFLADVGQGTFEEVDVIVAGGNYGWRRFEGTSDFAPLAPSSGPYESPIAQYAHPGKAGMTGLMEIGLSVTGGHVYRGSAIPELQGVYLFGDWSDDFATPHGTLLALEEAAPGNFVLSKVDLVGGNPVNNYLPAFGKDEDGEIYVATKRVGAPAGLDPVTGRPTGSLFRIARPSGPFQESLTAVRDTTLYSEDGTFSNGAGPALFAGRTSSGALRRGLLAFDLAVLPEGVTVTDATVRLVMNNTSSGPATMGLHRLSRTWGEAGSSSGTGMGASAQSGDATWTEAFFSPIGGGQLWGSPGGDFVASPSAMTVVDGNGPYLWSGEDLAADVQGWLDDVAIDPSANPGWILRGNEVDKSAKAFVSREGSPSGDRPQLTVTYRTGAPVSHRMAWERLYFPIGQFVDGEADGDSDRLPELLEYAWALDPTRADTLAPYLSIDYEEATSTLTIVFRRDPRAVDLVYEAQVGSSLSQWATIAESAGGGVTAGAGFLSEEVDPLDDSLLRVTVRETFADPEGGARFARLKVTRP